MSKRDVIDKKILEKIKNKRDLSEGHIRNAISKIKGKYPSTTQNGCAQIWCSEKHNFSIRNLLSNEDRKSLPSETKGVTHITKIKEIHRQNKKKNKSLFEGIKFKRK